LTLRAIFWRRRAVLPLLRTRAPGFLGVYRNAGDIDIGAIDVAAHVGEVDDLTGDRLPRCRTAAPAKV
jgi:hypothetical protein